MSLSNPTLTNPAQHFFQWAGSQGKLTWWDKENKREVEVKLPFEFIVLDQLATIVGYSKTDQSGFWSNEVRNIKNDELFVRTKKGPFEAGLYENLFQTAKRGGKYSKSIYLAHKVGNNWVIGNFKASGSALSAWIEFTKSSNVQQGKVVMVCGEQQEAQTGPYFPPTFMLKKWEADEYDIAVDLDRELQKYLNLYLSAPKVDEDGRGVDSYEDAPKATAAQQQDFEDRKNSRDIILDEMGGEPVNLDDIPF